MRPNLQPEHSPERADEQRLAQARHAFDQHVTAGKQGHERAEHQLVLADIDLGDFGGDAVEELLGRRFAAFGHVQAWGGSGAGATAGVIASCAAQAAAKARPRMARRPAAARSTSAPRGWAAVAARGRRGRADDATTAASSAAARTRAAPAQSRCTGGTKPACRRHWAAPSTRGRSRCSGIRWILQFGELTSFALQVRSPRSPLGELPILRIAATEHSFDLSWRPVACRGRRRVCRNRWANRPADRVDDQKSSTATGRQSCPARRRATRSR